MSNSTLRQFQLHKETVLEEVTSLCHLAKENFSYPLLSEELFNRVMTYTAGGKMVRASLVLETWSMFSGDAQEFPDHIVKAAALIEFLESALLIHDDIIDGDEVRRGFPAMHVQYQRKQDFSGKKISRPLQQRQGESAAVLVGDILFFMIFWFVGQIEMPERTRLKVMEELSVNVLHTGFGQLLDTTAGFNWLELDEEGVLSIYRHKTACYTFILPILLGVILSGAEYNRSDLENIGEALGIIYQVSDDRINLFGDPAVTGKPQGGDVREGKQTLYAYYTRRKLADKELALFNKLYGKPSISESEMEQVLNLMKSSGALEAIEEINTHQLARITQLLKKLPCSKLGKKKVLELAEVLINRRA